MLTNQLAITTLAALFVSGVFGFVGLALTVRALGARYAVNFRHTVGTELGRAFLFVDVGRLMWGNLLLVGTSVALVLAFTQSIALGALLAAVWVVLPRALLGLLKRRRQQAFRQQLPEMIGMLASSLKAGVAIANALDELSRQLTSPMRQELQMTLREQRLGATLEDAIAGMERRMPFEETRLLVSALRVGLRSGGSLAGNLESLAAALRRRLLLEGKIRALTAQGKMQAWVMGMLPFAVLLAMMLLDPSIATLYLHEPIGWAVLASVVCLQAVGVWMIRRLVSIEV